MKRKVCLLIFALMLLGLVTAQAEMTWSEWSELEPGLWQRTGSDPDVPDTVFEQRAQGPTAAELVMTEELQKGYGEKGLLAWVYRQFFGAEGKVIAHDAYNYDEHGTLTNGSLTTLNDAGKPDGVLSCMVWKNDDGGFETQLDQYDATDNLLFIVKTVYDKDGGFISSEKLNLKTNQFEPQTEPPAKDPIRDEWLQNRK